MGIRVSCPNGHSLNIKSFLAGKVGVCPKCDAKFRIPAEAALANESSPHASAAGRRGPAIQIPFTPRQQESHSERTTAVGSTFDDALDDLLGETADEVRVAPATASGRLPVAAPVVAPRAGAKQPSAAASSVRRTPSTPASPPSTPASTPSPASEAASVEAPSVWFVRPPSGGQYGPADEAAVRQWLSEGRINGPTLVWKAGWDDWRRADEVFDSLRRGVPVNIQLKSPTSGAQVVSAAPHLLDAAVSPSAAPRRKRGKGGGVLLVGFLAVLSVALVAALIMVLM